MQYKDLKQPKEQPKKAALGRGLKGLFPQTSENTGNSLTSITSRAISLDSSHIYQLAIEQVMPQADQPRRYFAEEALDTLTASIKQDGILQPIVVRKKDNHYEIIAGERRWRAATKAGLTTIPAIIKDLSDEDTFAIALVENIQRQDLTPLEEARAYQRLISQYKMTQEEVAARVGRERSTIANAVRLLQLPEDLQPMVDNGQISAGHARAILSLGSARAQRKLAERVVNEHLSVRQAERIARLSKSAPDMKDPAPTADSSSAAISANDLTEKLQRALGCRVILQDINGRGKLELHFNSYRELEQLTKHLLPKK